MGLLQLFAIIGGVWRRRSRPAPGSGGRASSGRPARHPAPTAGFRRRRGRSRRQRPHPAQRRAREAHRFRPGQLDDRRLDQIGQHLGGRPAGALDHGEIEFAAPGVADLALLDRAEPGRAQKAVDRRLRRADPRAAPLLAAVGLGRGDARRRRSRAGAASHSRAIRPPRARPRRACRAIRPVRSSIARRCIRAGISSDRSSSSSSPISSAPRRRARLRSSLWRARGRARYRRRARSR